MTTTFNDIQLFTPEQSWIPENEILRVEVGSTLHGTGIPGQEDRDEMGVVVEPIEQAFGLGAPFETFTFRTQPEGVKSGPEDLDLTIHSLRKMVKLLVKGNPTVLLALFVPQTHIVSINEVGRELQELAPAFHSKSAGKQFLGYLKAQRERLTGERKGRVQRPEYISDFGYDVKFAMHAVRLGFQGNEFMRTGRITLPMGGDEATICRNIRQGKWDKANVLMTIADLESDLEFATNHSDVSEQADLAVIETWLLDVYLSSWMAATDAVS